MSWWSKNHRYIISVFAIFIMGACVRPDDNVEFQTDLISTARVIDSVFRNGGEDSIRTVTKTLTINEGSSETKKLEEYNVLHDLQLLKDYNIATPRWADFYEISSRDSAGLIRLEYTTDNKRAPVQNMIVLRDDDIIRSMRIKSRKENVISKQYTDIEWSPGEGYIVRNQSSLLFQKPRVFQMEVRYDDMN